MTKNDAHQLLNSLKNEIQSLRIRSHNGGRCHSFPVGIWENVKKLTEYYSRKDLTQQLMLSSSQISKVLGRIKKPNFATLRHK